MLDSFSTTSEGTLCDVDNLSGTSIKLWDEYGRGRDDVLDDHGGVVVVGRRGDLDDVVLLGEVGVAVDDDGQGVLARKTLTLRGAVHLEQLCQVSCSNLQRI